MSTLHIFNGDCSANPAKKAGIQGDFLVWRELLCEGPCYPMIRDEKFTAIRSKYFSEKAYASKLEYQNKFIRQFDLLDNNYDEIVLWFEHDLFCQINMLAAISLIHQEKKETPISLICVGDVPDQNNRIGLGEIAPEEYPKLFHDRIILNSSDIKFAVTAWKYYCDDMAQFDQLVDIPVVFEYLSDTIQLNKWRLAVLENDKTGLEAALLNIINKHNYTKKDLVLHLLKKYNNLGYGDLQYHKLVESLKKYYHTDSDGIYSLNKAGGKLISE